MKINVGAYVSYVSRKNKGRAKVIRVYPGVTGPYVELFDRTRNKTVKVRPSQVTR